MDVTVRPGRRRLENVVPGRVLAADGPLARDKVTAEAGSERDPGMLNCAPYSDPSARLTLMERS